MTLLITMFAAIISTVVRYCFNAVAIFAFGKCRWANKALIFAAHSSMGGEGALLFRNTPLIFCGGILFLQRQ